MNFNLREWDVVELRRFISVGAGILAVLFVVLFTVQHQDQLQNVALASEAIDSLYLDEGKTYLNKEVTESQIREVQSSVSGVSGMQGRVFKDQIELAKSKYQAIDDLSALYQGDESVIVGDRVQDNLALNENIDLDFVASKRANLPGGSGDKLIETIDQEYSKVITVLEDIQRAETDVDTLSEVVNQDSVTEDVQEFIELETVLNDYQRHPQAQAVIDKYIEKSEAFGEELTENIDIIESDSELAETIFSSASLSTPLTGTPIDPRPLVALTFDDGPAENTLVILEILKEHDVPATFFQLGMYVEINPEIAKAVSDHGHELGNHSYSHANFDLLNADEIKHETDRTQDLIEAATGVRPTMYRSPYGNGRKKMVDLYPNLSPVYWNVDSEDWVSKDSETTLNHIADTIQHRSIILMHDTQESTTEALKELIPALKERGYIFVSPTQIPEADSYTL